LKRWGKRGLWIMQQVVCWPGMAMGEKGVGLAWTTQEQESGMARGERLLRDAGIIVRLFMEGA